MKKLASVAALALVVLIAVPAHAQTGITTRVTSPGSGATLQGTAGVSAEASAPTGVKRIVLSIEGATVDTKEPADLRQSVTAGYTWNTSLAIGSGGIARNGWYQIRVHAVANDGADHTSLVNVKVDNPPVAPSGLTQSTKGGTVTLSWLANPEPDLTGYRIEVDSGGGFATAGQTKGTSFSAEVAPGTYSYRVVALRSSPNYADGRASAPSGTVSATIAAPQSDVDGGGGGNAGNGGPGTSGGGSGSGGGLWGSGKTTARDVRALGRRFVSGGISRAGISLPGQFGLPTLPDSDTPVEWGTYKEQLPYDLPEGGIPLDTAPMNIAARSTTHVLPLDALRWIAAGALMLVTAAFLQLLGTRAEKSAARGT